MCSVMNKDPKRMVDDSANSIAKDNGKPDREVSGCDDGEKDLNAN